MGKHFTTGFILGAITGTIVAYLFTPEPLEEVKQTVAERGSGIMERIPDEAKAKAQELKEEAMQKAKEAKEKLPEHMEKVRKAKEELLGESGEDTGESSD